MGHTFETLWPLALIPIGIGYSAWWLTDFRRQQAKLPSLVERARKLGCPITPEDFGASMAVPDEQNAASDYLQFAKELAKLSVEEPDAFSRVFESGYPEVEVTPELLDAIAKAETADSLLRTACQKPFHRVYHLVEEVPGLIDDTARIARMASKYMHLRVKISVHEGDFDATRAHLDLLRQIAVHSHYQATQLSWLVQISAIARYISGLNDLLKAAYREIGVADWVQEQLAQRPRPSPLMPCVQGEIAYSLGYLKEIQRTGIKEVFDDKPPFPMSLRYFQSPMALDAYVVVGLQGIIESLENWPADENDPALVAKATKGHGWGGWWLRPSYSWPSVSGNVGEGLIGDSNRVKLAHAGLKVHRYDLQHGRFPHSNSEAGLGKEFFYAYSNNSFRLRLGILSY